MIKYWFSSAADYYDPDEDSCEDEDEENHEDLRTYTECPYCGSQNEIEFRARLDEDGDETGEYYRYEINCCKHLVGLVDYSQFELIDKYFRRYFTKNYAFNYSTIEHLAETKKWMIREDIYDDYLQAVYYISSKAYDKIKTEHSNLFDNFLDSF